MKLFCRMNLYLFIFSLLWFFTQMTLNYWFLRQNEPLTEKVQKLLILQTMLPVCAGTALMFMGTLALRRIQRLEEGTNRIADGDEPEIGGTAQNLPPAVLRMARRQRNFHKAVDEHSIVAITDSKGVITYVNDLFCKISGYSKDELIGKTHRVINSGKHPKEFFRDMWRTISGGCVWRGNIENRAKDGSYYFVATTIMPCLGPDGRPEQYIAVRTDVTEQKTIAGRLALLTHELEAKNRELEVLIYAVSHDLRSPLVNVQGFASVIREEIASLRPHFENAIDDSHSGSSAEAFVEIEDAARFICAGAEKMDALLKGLLAFSRLGRTMPGLQIVDAEKIVNESLDATRFQIDEAGAEVTLRPLPGCMADPALFGQVVSNLIDNALKYRDQNRPLKLSISGSSENSESFYRFEDNGIGIDEQHYDRVFELFHQLNPRIGGGYGIGLAIVRRALDRMGGRVMVESVLNSGTVFTVALGSGSQNSEAP